MANLILTYDLNGPHPTHHEMDKHLRALGPRYVTVRILETVWYVAGPATATQLCQYAQQLLSADDGVLVAEATSATWANLLVEGEQFKKAFEEEPPSREHKRKA